MTSKLYCQCKNANAHEPICSYCGLPANDGNTAYVGLTQSIEAIDRRRWRMQYAKWSITAVLSLIGAAAIYYAAKNSVFAWGAAHGDLILKWLCGTGLLLLFLRGFKRMRQEKVKRRAFIQEAMRKHRELYADETIDYVNYNLEKSAISHIRHHASDYYTNSDVDRSPDFFMPVPQNSFEDGAYKNKLQAQLVSGHCYRMTYQDAFGNITERNITARGVTSAGWYTYIEAYCHLRTDIRTFRRDRIIGYLIDIETGEIIDPNIITPRKSIRKKR